jgi:hypothetical protein
VQTVLWGVLVVGLSVAGFAVVRRFLPMDLRETHNANTAVIFGALYVMYGLIVGFSAYFASFQYDNAQRTAEAEASSVQELHRLAEGFPDGERQEVGAGAGRILRPDRDRRRLASDGGQPGQREGRGDLRGASA